MTDYRATLSTALEAYFNAAPSRRKNLDFHIEGIQPAEFETSAWDLAISTQSLGDVPQDLALDIARMYRAQQSYTDWSRDLLQSMYIHSPYDGTGLTPEHGVLVRQRTRKCASEPRVNVSLYLVLVCRSPTANT